MIWNSRFVILLLVLADLCGCTYLNYDLTDLPDPPVSDRTGMVVLFAGWTPPGTTVDGTGMYGVTQELRALGVKADVYAPSQWEDAARDVASLPNAARIPIAVVGYSLGAAGATRLASALEHKGIPIQTPVAIEPWHALPVPCNVREAVDIFSSDSVLSLSSRLEPGPGFAGALKQVNYSAISEGGGILNHWTISVVDGVHRMVRAEVLEGNHVRGHPATAGEAACTLTATAAVPP